MIPPSATLIMMIHVYFAYGAITKTPKALSACQGTTLTLAWDFDEKPKLDIAVWYKDGDQIGTLQNSSPSGFTHKVKYVQRGTIKLLNISLTDAGSYRFAVSYIVSSRLPSSRSDVNVTVKVPPVVPSSSLKTGTDELICSTPDLGSPPARVQIKVGSELQQSESAPVSQGQIVGCCVTGESVTCLKENADRRKMYCQDICPAPIAVETNEVPKTVGDAPRADFRLCYSCSGCNDTFNAADVPTKNCSGSCQKERYDNCHVVRSCSCKKMPLGCSKKGKIKTCYCDGELCNGRTSLKATMTLTIISAILSRFGRLL